MVFTKTGNEMNTNIIIYRDKNGNEIKSGMTIKHDNGDIEKIYSNINEDDLGVNATNKRYEMNHPDSNMPRQIYPLSQFNMNEWEII